jgi:type IX secretion system PorP/SprF family membrane protein
MKYNIILFLFVLNIKLLVAQDFIFSNPYNIRIIHNPAYTGIDQARLNVNLTHRNQFNPIPGPFKSSAFSSDIGLCKPSNVGVGLFAINSIQGDGFLTNNNFGLSTSVHIQKRKEASFSFGIQMGFIQQSVDWSKYVFSDQITYQGINKVVSSINASISPNVGIIKPDISAGLLFRKRILNNNLKESFRFYMIGLSINHFNNPNIGLINNYVLPVSTNFHIGFLNQPFKEKIGFSLNARIIQQQNFKNSYFDINAEFSKKGLIGIFALRSNTNNNFLSNTHYLGFGFGYENVYNDNSFKGVLNYDLNISGVSGNSFGIWELSVFLSFNKGCSGSKSRGIICNYDGLGKAPQF